MMLLTLQNVCEYIEKQQKLLDDLSIKAPTISPRNEQLLNKISNEIHCLAEVFNKSNGNAEENKAPTDRQNDSEEGPRDRNVKSFLSNYLDSKSGKNKFLAQFILSGRNAHPLSPTYLFSFFLYFTEVLLLQESLEFITKRHDLLNMLSDISVATFVRFEKIKLEITNKIINLLKDIKPEISIDAESSEEEEIDVVQFDINEFVPLKSDGIEASGQETPITRVLRERNKVVTSNSQVSIGESLETVDQNQQSTKNDDDCILVRADKTEFLYLRNENFKENSGKELVKCNGSKNGAVKQPTPEKEDIKYSETNRRANNLKETHVVKYVKQPYTCQLCKKSFDSRTEFESHSEFHDGKPVYACEDCDMVFLTRQRLRNHQYKHSGVKRYKCKICGQAFTQLGTRQNHMLTHTGKRTFGCSICGKTFPLKAHLQHHVYTHTGEKPYLCKICGQGFRQVTVLKRHMLSHAVATGHTCSECGEKFTDKWFLNHHRKLHEKPHACSVCKARFAKKEELEKHSQKHIIKPFRCDLCNTLFTSENKLKTHTKVHAKQKVFDCTHCADRFLKEDLLNLHLIKLHALKPYKCETCSKLFARQRLLTSHMVIHKEKTHKCKECGKAFSQSAHLRTHMFTHTNAKPYKCEACGKGFNQSSHLRTHMLVHLKG